METVKDEVFKLFTEGCRPYDDKVKALVPYAGTRNLYYQTWRRGVKPRGVVPVIMDPNERVRRLGFASNNARHKWIVEHQDEIRAYYKQYGRNATMKKYNIGTTTIVKLIVYHDYDFPGKLVKEVNEHQESQQEISLAGKDEPKLPDEASILDNFISTIERAISNYRNLKAENQQLKASNKKWQQMAGKLNQDIQTMIHSG